MPMQPLTSTDTQQLARIAGLNAGDLELDRRVERLRTLCSGQEPGPADLVVNVRDQVQRESGRQLGVIEILGALTEAQEALPVGQGRSCVDTAVALVGVLSR